MTFSNYFFSNAYLKFQETVDYGRICDFDAREMRWRWRFLLLSFYSFDFLPRWINIRMIFSSYLKNFFYCAIWLNLWAFDGGSSVFLDTLFDGFLARGDRAKCAPDLIWIETKISYSMTGPSFFFSLLWNFNNTLKYIWW